MIALSSSASLPYFDQLLQRLAAGDPAFERCFGRHVHWGYWPDPALAPAPDVPRSDGPGGDLSDRVAADYASAAEALTQLLLQRAQLQGGDCVLDVGCGFGGTIASLNDVALPLTLTGVNIDPRQLDRARQRVQSRPGNTIDWIEADAGALPCADASQDVVLAVECIFHFPSRDAFLAEVRRVLRPGGRLVLSDFVPVTPLAWLLRLNGRGGAVQNSTYGSVNCSWDRQRYARRARRLDLTLESDQDITAATLPTYPVVRRLFAGMGADQAVRDTARIEQLSRRGWLRYRVLSFQKGADVV
jgi:SAM-dependent methyltransferase